MLKQLKASFEIIMRFFFCHYIWSESEKESNGYKQKDRESWDERWHLNHPFLCCLSTRHHSLIIRFTRLTLYHHVPSPQNSTTPSFTNFILCQWKTGPLNVILPFHLKSHYQDFKSERTTDPRVFSSFSLSGDPVDDYGAFGTQTFKRVGNK